MSHPQSGILSTLSAGAKTMGNSFDIKIDYKHTSPTSTKEAMPSISPEARSQNTPHDMQSRHLSSDEDGVGEKKKRTRLNAAQAALLRQTWSESCFPSTEKRCALSKQTGLTGRQVQVWFQNQRQKQRNEEFESNKPHSVVTLHPLTNINAGYDWPSPSQEVAHSDWSGSETDMYKRSESHLERGRRISHSGPPQQMPYERRSDPICISGPGIPPELHRRSLASFEPSSTRFPPTFPGRPTASYYQHPGPELHPFDLGYTHGTKREHSDNVDDRDDDQRRPYKVPRSNASCDSSLSSSKVQLPSLREMGLAMDRTLLNAELRQREAPSTLFDIATGRLPRLAHSNPLTLRPLERCSCK